MDIAVHSKKGPVSLKDVARRQEITEKYLEQIVSSLRIGRLVTSTRGSRGGYKLARRPEKIRLLEIIEAMEGPIVPVFCTAESGLCHREKECVTREIWLSLQQTICKKMNSIKLSDMVKRYYVKNRRGKSPRTT